MAELRDAFLSKAEKSLAGARSEVANGRFNNAANRMYYACFQAAVAALLYAGVQRPAAETIWSHGQIQREFSSRLVGNRKPFAADFDGIFSRVSRLRQTADYRRDTVSRRLAEQHLARVGTFVEAIATYISERSGG